MGLSRSCQLMYKPVYNGIGPRRCGVSLARTVALILGHGVLLWRRSSPSFLPPPPHQPLIPKVQCGTVTSTRLAASSTPASCRPRRRSVAGALAFGHLEEMPHVKFPSRWSYPAMADGLSHAKSRLYIHHILHNFIFKILVFKLYE